MSLRICQMSWLSQLDCPITSFLCICHTPALLTLPFCYLPLHCLSSLASLSVSYHPIPTHVLSSSLHIMLQCIVGFSADRFHSIIVILDRVHVVRRAERYLPGLFRAHIDEVIPIHLGSEVLIVSAHAAHVAQIAACVSVCDPLNNFSRAFVL